NPDDARQRHETTRQESLTLYEMGGPVEHGLRYEAEYLAELGEVRARVHPHQGEVVALGHHAAVPLAWPLCGDQEPQAELAALCGDLDHSVPDCHTEGRLRIRGTEVVCLVDDQQHRSPLRASAPEILEHGQCHDQLLLMVLVAPEVEY